MDVFDHERLDIYQIAMEFIVLADGIVEKVRSRRANLADQLDRAALSIVLNVAEGAGEYSSKEKLRFYRMAQRSATECAAVLDVCKRLKIDAGPDLAQGRALLLRIVSMLIKLAKNRLER